MERLDAKEKRKVAEAHKDSIPEPKAEPVSYDRPNPQKKSKKKKVRTWSDVVWCMLLSSTARKPDL